MCVRASSAHCSRTEKNGDNFTSAPIKATPLSERFSGRDYLSRFRTAIPSHSEISMEATRTSTINDVVHQHRERSATIQPWFSNYVALPPTAIDLYIL